MRKNLYLKITLTILICVVALNKNYVFGLEIMKGDLLIEEGATMYNPTLLDIELERQKLENINTKITPFADPGGKYKVIAVPVFKQETNYYCGPATFKQVVHYVNGRSESQYYYNQLLKTNTSGTDMSQMVNPLRQLTGKNYVYSNIGNNVEWRSKIYYSVYNKMPAILDINKVNNNAFPYNTNGHFVNISGYDTSNGEKVRITDPYAAGLGNRWYNMNSLYNANNAHWRKAIIW